MEVESLQLLRQLHWFQSCLLYTSAVNRFIMRERLGTKEIREQAFRELEKAEEEQGSDKAGTDLIHRIRLLYIRHVLENTDDEGMDPQAEIALYKICLLYTSGFHYRIPVKITEY